ncbi:hypothetical protein LCGC14_2908540 [marine sediment metagenome]|uniref:Uncharacterized protein n=1 Tax=marine sediment metagenome TaxID=412755 RepID=A0A0F9A002_9ZZZZ
MDRYMINPVASGYSAIKSSVGKWIKYEDYVEELEQLRKDLKKFGSHKAGCDMTFHGADYCSCGFEEASKER